MTTIRLFGQRLKNLANLNQQLFVMWAAISFLFFFFALQRPEQQGKYVKSVNVSGEIYIIAKVLDKLTQIAKKTPIAFPENNTNV